MPKALNCMLVTVSIIVIGRPIAALASPVTDADIRGKVICWSGGPIITYGKDGNFYSTQVGNGKWHLVGNKLTVDGVRGHGTFTITKQGGTLLASTIEANTLKKYSGKYCN
jgi:hypothetical protein